MRLYGIARLILLADAAYWIYLIGRDGEGAIPGWRAGVNVATFYGGWLLLLVVLLVAAARRRAPE